jgi:hypothetical protein
MSGVFIQKLQSAARFCKLSRPEKSAFLSAVLAMPVVRLALLVISMRRVLEMLSRLGRRWPIRLGHTIPVARAAKRIAQAKHFCPGSTCLSEAIAGHFVMSRLGLESEIRIGVAKTEGQFKAHAWLECKGGIVIGDPSPEGTQYSPMPSLRRFVA